MIVHPDRFAFGAFLCATLLVCVVGAASVRADGPDAHPPATAAGPAIESAPADNPAAPLPARRLSPFAREIAQAIDAQRMALIALQERFERTADPNEARAIQREIEATKQGTELQILRIQARYARLGGREAAARRIEAAIEQLLHPPAVVPVVDRTARGEHPDTPR